MKELIIDIDVNTKPEDFTLSEGEFFSLDLTEIDDYLIESSVELEDVIIDVELEENEFDNNLDEIDLTQEENLDFDLDLDELDIDFNDIL